LLHALGGRIRCTWQHPSFYGIHGSRALRYEDHIRNINLVIAGTDENLASHPLYSFRVSHDVKPHFILLAEQAREHETFNIITESVLKSIFGTHIRGSIRLEDQTGTAWSARHNTLPLPAYNPSNSSYPIGSSRVATSAPNVSCLEWDEKFFSASALDAQVVVGHIREPMACKFDHICSERFASDHTEERLWNVIPEQPAGNRSLGRRQRQARHICIMWRLLYGTRTLAKNEPGTDCWIVNKDRYAVSMLRRFYFAIPQPYLITSRDQIAG